jgi:hypothetical protein
MAINLRGLDLSNGSEVVNTQIEMNGGDLYTYNRLRARQELQVGFDFDDNAYDGALVINNSDTNSLNITYSTYSDTELNFSIENTKLNLEDGDILVFNETNSTFKVDNISNYAGGGTGNYHVLVVDFLENEDYATTTIVPEGAQIDRLVIKSNGLTNGIEPLIFSIGDVSNITLATQGIEFDNSAGTFNLTFFNDNIDIIVGIGEAGTFRSNWSGAGFGTGNGKAYLFYWTPLS